MVKAEIELLLAVGILIGVLTPILGMQPSQSPLAAEPVVDTTGSLIAKYSVSKSLSLVNCAKEYSFKCADCRNIAVCAGEDTPMSIQSCASFNPNAPYCVNGACSPTTAADSGVCGAEFRCSSEGYFPHPNDCSKYFFCDKVNGDAYEYSCGENRVYLSRQKSCADRTNETDCEIIDCRKSKNGFLTYGPHLAYYAYCSESNGRKETVIYKCPDEDTSEFDMDTLSCVYRCPGEGRFFNPGNCSTFYECYKSGPEYQAIQWSCPMFYRYNTLLQRCEKGKC